MSSLKRPGVIEMRTVSSPKHHAPSETEPNDREASIADHEKSIADLDARSRALLTSWMDKYVEIASRIDELKFGEGGLEEIKREQIEPLRLKLGLTKIDSDEWYIARRQGRSSLDKEKVRRVLYENRVPLKVIAEAFEKATTRGKAFTEIKRKRAQESDE